MNVALTGPSRFQPKSRRDEAMREARTCYDHIAGVLGVGLATRLTEREFVILSEEAGEVTPAGAEFLSNFGIDLSGAYRRRRIFCRPCIDWTERRSHIGGAIGAALANRFFELNWIERVRDSRALTITPAGRRGLMQFFHCRFRRFDPFSLSGHRTGRHKNTRHGHGLARRLAIFADRNWTSWLPTYAWGIEHHRVRISSLLRPSLRRTASAIPFKKLWLDI